MNDFESMGSGGVFPEKANPGKRIAAFLIDFISFYLLCWVFLAIGGILLVVAGGVLFSLTSLVEDWELLERVLASSFSD